MRRRLLALVLVAAAGCQLPVDELRKQAAFAARDFREVNVFVVPKLADADAQKEWTENVVTSAVRCHVMVAALSGERSVDRAKLEADEMAAVLKAREDQR